MPTIVQSQPASGVPQLPPFATYVSSTGRYLLDQYGKPFLIFGNQLLPGLHNGSHADIQAVLSDRQSRGFNAMWMCLAPDAYIGANDNFSNNDGDLPWDAGGNYNAPNPTYWTKVDQIMLMAQNYGCTVFACPIETAGVGMTHSSSQGGAACTTYGTFLGNRYKGYPNIVWFHGNDFGTSNSWISSQQTAANSTLIKNVLTAIKAAGDTHVHTIQLNFNRSLSDDDTTAGGWASTIDFVGAYTYYQTYDCVQKGYLLQKSDGTAGALASPKPVWMQEANYEGANNAGGSPASTYTLRAQNFWTMLAGGCGQMWGNKTVHHFLAGWQAALSSAGAVQATYWYRFFANRPWWNLVPDTSNTFVTAGFGTYDSGTTVLTSTIGSYATAALTSDGALGVVYCPQSTTLTVNMAKMRGTTAAHWFDASNNTFSTIAGSPFANTGTQTFATPGNNNDGNPDWVLVLEA